MEPCPLGLHLGRFASLRFRELRRDDDETQVDHEERPDLECAKLGGSLMSSSVTRLGKLIVAKLARSPINRPIWSHWTIFVKVSKSIIFLVKSILGNFYRHLVIFFWSH